LLQTLLRFSEVFLTYYTTHANKATSRKQEYLEEFLDCFELLKLEIRLCTDMKMLSAKRMCELSLLMDSIGKQITGWRNASSVKSQNH
jgi:hypothetical protein